MKSGMDEDLYHLYRRYLDGSIELVNSKWSGKDTGMVIQYRRVDYLALGKEVIDAMVLIPVDEYDKDCYRLYTPDYDNYEL